LASFLEFYDRGTNAGGLLWTTIAPCRLAGPR